MIKQFVTYILFSFLFYSAADAQIEREVTENNESVDLILNQNVVYGKLVDSTSGKGLEFASVQLFIKQPNNDKKAFDLSNFFCRRFHELQ